MNEHPTGMSNEPTPDFAWPYRVTELLFEWLSTRGQKLLEVFRRRIPHFVAQAACWSCLAYIGLVWICLCYIRYPVIPYGFWEMVEWLVVVTAITFGAIFTVHPGGTLVVALLFLLTTLAVYFALSLFYVSCVLLDAVRRHSFWLKAYRPVMFAGATASLALATFVDGSYRFWDRPFNVTVWAEFVFVTGSAWAALFCHLVRNKLMEPGRPSDGCEVDSRPCIGFWASRLLGCEWPSGGVFSA